jgi:hypothetical protein
MARGVREGATIIYSAFSGNLQPQSLASYDPITRRNTILVATIVPTLKLGAQTDLSVPADRYYCHWGSTTSSADVPVWFTANAGTITYGNWDGTEGRQYTNFTAATAGQPNTKPRFIYPLGNFGQATYFTPKNVSVTRVLIRFRARFNDNADYTTTGVGAKTGATTNFSVNTEHFIQVLRNAGSWELGSCDGATITQSSGGTGDGSWHDFEVVWITGELRFYVDGTLTVTKTTNVPTQPLGPFIAASGTNDIDIVDYEVEWA